MSAAKSTAQSASAVHIPNALERDGATQDIPLLISYPKSGRTWIRYIFALIQKPLELSHAGTGSHISVLGREFKAIPSGLANGRLCLFMHRNPIDTATSYYFHITRKDFRLHRKLFYLPRLYFETRLPPRDLRSFLLHPGYGVEKTCKFNRAWLDYFGGRSDALVFSYEDMKQRPAETLSKVFAFSRIEGVDMDWLLEQSSFTNMQAAEKSGRARHLKLYQGRSKDPESAKIRRGKVLGYREYLDENDIQYFHKLCRGYGFEA